ncbi:MAG: CocE/NonD family hydrolase [Anaerolineales bacterium]
MQIKTSFPHTIREIENLWIPLTDGTRLAARLWLPGDAERTPVPAILEYIPYRKNDGTVIRDAIMHPYFAGHGYACVRVDMRGSGDSDGLLLDEYLKQEQDDALEVIAWIAAQAWCTGRVGIMGKSWGGFNGLQIAARQPPALKAVITLYFTDDRYHDDVHYMGGCVLASDLLAWASTMFAFNARPPDPRFVGERWREMWFERMEKTPPYIEAWLTHQRRDSFWKHGSVCETYRRPGISEAAASLPAITCPVYAIGGWADAYTNSVPRVLAGLTSPKKGLIGPWGHAYPVEGIPGPAIGFMQECLRWWDYWLKDVDTGVMNEPLLRVWMQDSHPPATHHAEWPGRWVAEPEWPSPTISNRQWPLNQNGQRSKSPLQITGAQTHGLDSGAWCPFGVPGDMPSDQRMEDGLALCFDSEPLEAPQEVLGFPEVTLTLAVDKPNALVAVRLCDVDPSGASTRVSWGLLNLTHRESHEHPTPLEPGQRYSVTVRLNALGHRLAAGHCWRVAVSPTYWPQAWPSPEPVTLTIFPEGCSATLPVRAPRPEDDALRFFEPPEIAPPLKRDTLRASRRSRHIQRDVVTGVVEVVDHVEGGFRITANDNGLESETDDTTTYRIVEGDPLSASVTCEWMIRVGRGDWQTRVETKSVMTSDTTHFRVTNVLNAYEGNTRVFSKAWDFSVPRDLI